MPITERRFQIEQDNRRETRYPFRWPVTFLVESAPGAQTRKGVTHDISVGGCSVLTEHHMVDGPVNLWLALPLEYAGAAKNIIEVRARVTYTVLSAGFGRFRSGFQFLQFKEDGRDLLHRAIKLRAVSSVGRLIE